MSDKLDLKAIKERCDAATPGPWSACREAYSEDAHHLYTGKWVWYEYTKSTFWSKEDMDFCAHAREDVPKLLEEVEKLQRQWEGLETVVLKQDAEIARLRSRLDDTEDRAELDCAIRNTEINKLRAGLEEIERASHNILGY